MDILWGRGNLFRFLLPCVAMATLIGHGCLGGRVKVWNIGVN